MEVQVLSSALERPARAFRGFRENRREMIILYPIVLVAAVYLMAKSRQRGLGRRGWGWFAAWVGAGALFVFSLLTGFSIGLFLLPLATVAMFWLALQAPYWREVAGFPVGAAIVVLALFVAV